MGSRARYIQSELETPRGVIGSTISIRMLAVTRESVRWVVGKEVVPVRLVADPPGFVMVQLPVTMHRYQVLISA